MFLCVSDVHYDERIGESERFDPAQSKLNTVTP